MKLTLYTADCTGDAKNCVYPNKDMCIRDRVFTFLHFLVAEF